MSPRILRNSRVIFFAARCWLSLRNSAAIRHPTRFRPFFYSSILLLDTKSPGGIDAGDPQRRQATRDCRNDGQHDNRGDKLSRTSRLRGEDHAAPASGGSIDCRWLTTHSWQLGPTCSPEDDSS